MISNFSQRQNGNFLVIVSFVATSFVLFFSLFTYIAKSYLIGQENSEITAQANYAAESVLENLPYEYNQNISLNANTKKIDENVPLCKKFTQNAEQAVMDFGENCESGVEIGSGQSKITKSATRMTQGESGYLDRYQLFEYRLTRSEFLEKDKDGNNYAKPDHLKITWLNDRKEENPKIEFILVSWENKGKTTGENPKEIMSSDISVQRLSPSHVIFDQATKKNSFDLYDISANIENTPLFCNVSVVTCKNKEYILFVKSFTQPLHFTINGIGSDSKPIAIPSRFLSLESKATIENEQNPLKSITKTFKAQRQFYTDFDSDFPYAKYEIR